MNAQDHKAESSDARKNPIEGPFGRVCISGCLFTIAGLINFRKKESPGPILDFPHRDLFS